MSLVSVKGELLEWSVPKTDQDLVVKTSEGTWIEVEFPVPRTAKKAALNIGNKPLLELR
jgi:hypothetical protein